MAQQEIRQDASPEGVVAFGRYLEDRFGVSATVGIGLQIVNAYETYKDVIADIERFFDRKNEFEMVQNVLNKIEPIQQQLDALDKNADPGLKDKVKNCWNTFCDSLGLKEKLGIGKVNSYEEAKKEVKMVMDKYDEMKIVFGDSERMTQEADKILQQRRIYSILQLVASYGRLMTVCYKLHQSSIEMKKIEKELNEIKEKYIQSILKQMECNNNNNNEINEKQLIRKITFAQQRLKAMDWIIKKEIKNGKCERMSSGIEAIFSGLNFLGSICQIRSLSDVASKSQIATQSTIAAFQGVATVGHITAAACAHLNVLKWENIENEVENLLTKMDCLEKSFLSS